MTGGGGVKTKVEFEDKHNGIIRGGVKGRNAYGEDNVLQCYGRLYLTSRAEISVVNFHILKIESSKMSLISPRI